MRAASSFTGRTVHGCYYNDHPDRRVVNRMTPHTVYVLAAPRNTSRVSVVPPIAGLPATSRTCP